MRLPMRKTISVEIERSITFGLLGMMFIFAYPDHRRVVASLCFVGVVATELLQAIFSPKYDRMEGAVFTAMGATAGLIAGAAILQIVSMISTS